MFQNIFEEIGNGCGTAVRAFTSITRERGLEPSQQHFLLKNIYLILTG